MSDRPRILVVDDDRMMAKTLGDILRVKGYAAEVAHSGPEALRALPRGRYDCVLSDVKMPGMNGVALYRAVRAQQPDLPVVLMTAYSDDALVREGLIEGVIGVLPKPLEIHRLLSFFETLRAERSIAIVDDDPQFCRTLGDILRARGFVVRQISDPHAAVEELVGDGQVVLLDMKLNSLSGLEVLREIKERHPALPVLLVTGYGQDMATEIGAALAEGAHACLYKPLEVEELLRTLAEIHKRELGRVLGEPGRRG